jgi:DNA-3-methyladenine glycosylase II
MAYRINTIEDVRKGLVWLAERDSYLAQAYRRFGDPPLRRHPPGLASLSRIIIGQQVSTAAAAAISLRFDAVFHSVSAERLAQATDDDFREAGLSRPKVMTFRALAAALLSGLRLDPADSEIGVFRANLLAIRGIGPWTADLYALECLGLSDSWPASDLALQEAWRLLSQASARPDAKQITAIASQWQPWRAVAARLLWHSYRGLKASDG